MAGNPPENRGAYRPHYSSIDGTTSAFEYATNNVDSWMNNNRLTYERLRANRSEESFRPHSVHVWGHGPEGPQYVGSWERTTPHTTRDGVRGVMLHNPPGGLPSRFMPDSDVHAITHKPDRKEERS